MNEKQRSDAPEKKGFWKNKLVIFFLGPLIIFTLAGVISRHLFYDQNDSTKTKIKFVLLLFGGLLFYAAIITFLLLKFA